MPLFLDEVPGAGAQLPAAANDTPETWKVLRDNNGPVVPDVQNWHPGDVILVSASDPEDLSHRAIKAVQRSMPDLEERDCAAIHVAIFDGQHVWEISWPGNVKCRTIAEFFDQGRCYAVRRFTRVDVDAELLVDYLGSRETVRYLNNIGRLPRLLIHRARGRALPAYDMRRLEICTTYVAKALQVAGGDWPRNLILPADYVGTDLAEARTIHWAAA